MKRFRALILLFFIGIVLACSGGAALRPESRTVELTLLHTNDTHGHLLPFSYPETFDPDSPLALLKARQNIGGAARRAALVKRIRRERPNTLLIDAGDICDGTPFSIEYRGDADIAAMNAIGYDLACPGNHEYNNTLAQVRKMIADARFPLLSANSFNRSDGTPLYRPWIVKEIGGARVAFFGLMTYSARTYPAAREGLRMEPPLDTARELAPELRKRADLVFAVTHLGVSEDRLLAASVPGIDVIVGGHSHTLVPAPFLVGDVPTAPNSVNGTVIVQNHEWGGTLGRLDLTLHRSPAGRWTVRRYHGELIPVTSRIPEDPAVARVVAGFWDPIRAKYAEVIGTAAADFAQKGPDRAEYNLVADAVREELGVELVLENLGGVRAPLVKGPMTYGDMVTLDPFSNTIVTFQATGRQLKEILARFRPAVSGIRYAVEGARLIDSRVGDGPIQDDRIYTGATNSYYAPIILGESIPAVDTKRARLETIIAYIRRKRVIEPRYDGRRIVRGAGDFEGPISPESGETLTTMRQTTCADRPLFQLF